MSPAQPPINAPAEAVVIVLLHDAQVLLIQRAAGCARPGVWSPPTGRVEPGESQRQAVVREAREELGLRVQPHACLWECLTDDARYRLHWWLVEAAPAPLQLNRSEIADWRWLAIDRFGELKPHFPQHEPFFRQVLPEWLATQCRPSTRT